MSIISRHKRVGTRNASSQKTHLSFKANVIIIDSLATQGHRAPAAILLVLVLKEYPLFTIGAEANKQFL